MQRMGPRSRALETFVRLRRGFVARRVTASITVPLEFRDPELTAEVFTRFVRAVDAGMFGPAGVPVSGSTVRSERRSDESICTLEADYPKMRPEAFAVLARMVDVCVPDATRLEIREHAPELALLVRSTESESDTTLLDVPWRVDFPLAAPPAVTVEFREAAPDHAVGVVVALLGTWVDVVACGGFRGGCARPASAVTGVEIRQRSERLVDVQFEHLSCAHEGIESLFQALCLVHELAPIACIQIAGKTE